MRPSRETSDFRIWGLAFGYFAFYVPYSGLTKALSQGSLPGMAGRPVTGYTILPATVVGTAGLLLALITAARGWRHIGRWRVPGLGLSLPSVRWATLLSGVATAVIIATTTLNYTFAGISILLALLLMRGGVLIIAPFVDLTTGRRVSAFSWAAMALSLAAVGLALSNVGSYQMTLVAAMNIAAYLGGYVVRLNVMSRLAKDVDPDVNRRYFFEETFVAAVALILIPSLVALVRAGDDRGRASNGLHRPLHQPAVRSGACDRAPLRRALPVRVRGSTSTPGRTRSASRSIAALLCFRALRPRTSWRSSWAGQLTRVRELGGVAIVGAALVLLMVETLGKQRARAAFAGPACVSVRVRGQHEPVADGPGDLQYGDRAPTGAGYGKTGRWTGRGPQRRAQDDARPAARGAVRGGAASTRHRSACPCLHGGHSRSRQSRRGDLLHERGNSPDSG